MHSFAKNQLCACKSSLMSASAIKVSHVCYVSYVSNVGYAISKIDNVWEANTTVLMRRMRLLQIKINVTKVKTIEVIVIKVNVIKVILPVTSYISLLRQ